MCGSVPNNMRGGRSGFPYLAPGPFQSLTYRSFRRFSSPGNRASGCLSAVFNCLPGLLGSFLSCIGCFFRRPLIVLCGYPCEWGQNCECSNSAHFSHKHLLYTVSKEQLAVDVPSGELVATLLPLE